MDIFQLNQHKSFTVAVELERKLKSLDEYICLLTEPYKVKCKLAAKPIGAKALVVKSATPPRAAILHKGCRQLICIESLCNPGLRSWSNKCERE